MKKYLLKTVIVFFACVLSINAQEKKKVHIKMVKNEDGKVTEIDTVFEASDYKGMYFYGDEMDELKLDSILEEFEIIDKEGMKFITISDKIHTEDEEGLIWLKVDADVDGDTVKMIKHIHISKDGDKNITKSKKEMVWVMSDSSEAFEDIHISDDHVYVMKSGEGKKVKVIKKGMEESMVWTTDSAGTINISDDGKVYIYKTGDCTFDILKSDEDENVVVEKIVIDKSGENEKTFDVYITDDGEKSKVKIETIEGDFEDADENVKIYKYKTDDGKIVFKAEITDEKVKGDDNKKVNKIKIKQGQEEGIFDIEFELEKKDATVLQVDDENGKTVYSKKIKKFEGSYSGKIDISKEPDGTYILKLIQGEELITKQKISKK
ncbi:T9SS type A sorting domain-containing protein [Bacteroidota bacterium]